MLSPENYFFNRMMKMNIKHQLLHNMRSTSAVAYNFCQTNKVKKKKAASHWSSNCTVTSGDLWKAKLL